MSFDVAVPLSGILAIFNNVAPGREAEFEEWSGRADCRPRISARATARGRNGNPRYFNFYVTTSVEVMKPPAYLARLD